MSPLRVHTDYAGSLWKLLEYPTGDYAWVDLPATTGRDQRLGQRVGRLNAVATAVASGHMATLDGLQYIVKGNDYDVTIEYVMPTTTTISGLEFVV